MAENTRLQELRKDILDLQTRTTTSEERVQSWMGDISASLARFSQENEVRWQRTNDRLEAVVCASDERFGAMMSILQELKQRESQRESATARSNSPSPSQAGNPYPISTRFSKIDFPNFEGEGVKDWLFRVEQFFEIDKTPEEFKVTVASMHLHGLALRWHHLFLKHRTDRSCISWSEYTDALRDRFGNVWQENPMAELKRLVQTGSVNDYKNRFDCIVEELDLAEDYTVACFIDGLHGDLQPTVKMWKPKTISQAYEIARFQEEQVRKYKSTFMVRAPSRFLPDNKPGLLPKPTHLPALPAPPTRALLPAPTEVGHRIKKRLSQAEIDEKRAKGICFWCDAKFEPGHRCARKQIFSVDLIEVEEVEGMDTSAQVEQTSNKEEQELTAIQEAEFSEEIEPRISISALHGIPAYHTMRVTGKIIKRAIHILVDSGSTHNFLDLQVAKLLGLPLEENETLRVMVADGNELQCSFICRRLFWRIQNQEYSADVLVLPLAGCEFVLGVQWLESLGTIIWNFKSLTMSFRYEGKRHVLRGNSSIMIKSITGKQLIKASSVENCQMIFLQMYALTCSSSDQNSETVPRELQPLCEQFKDIFEVPKGLPPIRKFDHSIPLKEGSAPVCLKPYRHAAVQKTIIEQLVREMLQAGIIRESMSPFASPVVLVKKKDGSWRFCIDYRRLNEITIKAKFPIPLVEELLWYKQEALGRRRSFERIREVTEIKKNVMIH